MKRRTPHTLVLFAPLLTSRLAFADASYQESVQITGGQLVETLRSVPFLPKSMKQLLDPLKTTKMVHGNQYASVSPQSTEIIDLDQETVTRIDHDKKTYSVTTFAQMREALQDSAKKLQQARTEGAKAQPPAAAAPADTAPASRVQVTFDVSLTDPGVSKVLNGQSAKEQVLTMKAHVTDPNPPADNPVQTVTYSIITDIWTASEPPEVKEVEGFYARYARKLMQGVDMAALLKDLSPSIDGAAVAPPSRRCSPRIRAWARRCRRRARKWRPKWPRSKARRFWKSPAWGARVCPPRPVRCRPARRRSLPRRAGSAPWARPSADHSSAASEKNQALRRIPRAAPAPPHRRAPCSTKPPPRNWASPPTPFRLPHFRCLADSRR